MCGSECGPMHRTKVKEGKYICSDCSKKCSKWQRLSELTVDEVKELISFMEHRERMYELIGNDGKSLYPSSAQYSNYGIEFVDKCGVLVIRDKRNNENKVYHEVIRYDEIAAYKPYMENSKNSEGQEVFKESGVVLRLADKNHYGEELHKKGIRRHPFAYQDIKLCYTTNEKYAQCPKATIDRLDHVFGLHDNSTGLFSFKPSLNKQREMKANIEMGKTLAGTLGAVLSGEGPSEELKEQLETAQGAVNEAASHGLSVYSQRADELESNAK